MFINIILIFNDYLCFQINMLINSLRFLKWSLTLNENIATTEKNENIYTLE